MDVEDFLLSLSPKEIIANTKMADIGNEFVSVKTSKMVKLSPYYDYSFDYDNAKKTLLAQMNAYDLSALGLQDKKAAVCVCGGLLDYVNATQKRNSSHINTIKYQKNYEYMFWISIPKKSEIFETLAEKKRYGSLLWVIDKPIPPWAQGNLKAG